MREQDSQSCGTEWEAQQKLCDEAEPIMFSLLLTWFTTLVCFTCSPRKFMVYWYSNIIIFMAFLFHSRRHARTHTLTVMGTHSRMPSDVVQFVGWSILCDFSKILFVRLRTVECVAGNRLNVCEIGLTTAAVLVGRQCNAHRPVKASSSQ